MSFHISIKRSPEIHQMSLDINCLFFNAQAMVIFVFHYGVAFKAQNDVLLLSLGADNGGSSLLQGPVGIKGEKGERVCILVYESLNNALL